VINICNRAINLRLLLLPLINYGFINFTKVNMQVKVASIQILEQIKVLVKTLNDKQYSEASQILLGSSIGKHIRHILEFYDIFIHSHYTGVINYDEREHNQILEVDRFKVLLKLNELTDGLKKVVEDFPLQMKTSYSTDNVEISNMESSVMRELAYNLEHAIHHMAFIKMAVCNLYPEVTLSDNFGVAFSTIRFNNQIKE